MGWVVHLVISASANEVKEALGEGVKIRPIKVIKNRVCRIILKPFIAYYEAFKTKAYIFHIHDPELVPWAVIALLFGKKIIYDAHEDVSSDIKLKQWIPIKMRFTLAHLVGLVETICGSIFFAVVAATPHIQKKFLMNNAKAICIHNYPLIGASGGVSGSKNLRNTVCYVGALSKDRGLIEMVSALRGVDSSVCLEILGDCHDEGLMGDLKEVSTWRRVKYGGFKNRDAVENLLMHSFAGLAILHPTPTFVNALPTKIFEYMAAGIPVIVSSMPILRKIVEDSKCGLCVDPFNIDEIGSAIQYLYDNPDICKAMGCNGRKAVEQKFNWSGEVEKLLLLYTQAASN